jgi:phosphopantetheinyl transferase (holo-ACP synthase)
MPLLLYESTQQQARLLIWDLTETEEELKSLYGLVPTIVSDTLSLVKHPLRRRQKLAAALLVAKITDNQFFVPFTTVTGKPYLPDAKPISFSNCESKVVLIQHARAVGIDIEEMDGRALKIRERFLHTNEYIWLKKTHLMNGEALIWGVKESLFKAIGGGGIEFKCQLEVAEPDFVVSNTEGSGKAYFYKEGVGFLFHYYFRNLDGALLVYTIAENMSS